WRHRRCLPDRNRSAGLIQTKTHAACGGFTAAGSRSLWGIRNFNRASREERRSILVNEAKKPEIPSASRQ
ncbi:MAG: hypothetical protein AAFY24_23795, partial [Pseudomonadota bacterium]